MTDALPDRHSAAELLSELERADLLADREEAESFILRRAGAPELPLYMRALVGVGAFITSICLIGFLGTAGLIEIDSEIGLIAWGLVFGGLAIVLYRRAGDADDVRHSFLVQASFAAMAVGKALFVAGLSILLESPWASVLGGLIVTGATYHVYRLSIDRFLSSLSVLLALLVNILMQEAWQVPLFNLYCVAITIGAAVPLTHGRVAAAYIPLGYAFVVALCVGMVFVVTPAGFGPVALDGADALIVVGPLMTSTLVILIIWSAGGIAHLRRPPIQLAIAGAVVLGTVAAPGLTLAIGLMVLGYARHERLLIVLGALLLPVFLYEYYHSLALTLLEKSAILVGSGALLLAACLLLHLKGWAGNGRGGRT